MEKSSNLFFMLPNVDVFKNKFVILNFDWAPQFIHIIAVTVIIKICSN